MFTTVAAFFLSLLFTANASAFYNPIVGRWLNRDPLGEKGGINLVAFAANNPITVFDRDGLIPDGPGIPPPLPPRSPSPTPPATLTPFESCVVQCIDANGGRWALAALGVSTIGGGTVPKPFGAGALGGGCCTTVPSLIQHYTGLGLRQLARRLNPVMNAVQCAAAGWLLGSTASCAAICANDNDAY
ncbi:MAG: hypothetical protein HY043_07770 [Verrucomicrobia bacterium]|nr:hypothetical protein [Verrucomicrobiota bacterium]